MAKQREKHGGVPLTTTCSEASILVGNRLYFLVVCKTSIISYATAFQFPTGEKSG